jgi:hypothetical protein
LRDTQLAAQFVDILYNLNELDFELDKDMGLDDAWPAFSAKSFAARSPLNTESDTRSLLSTLSIDAEKSIEQMREKVSKLRAECRALTKERNTAVEEKDESDIAWNELVSKLKLEAFSATEECERATTILAPVQKRCDTLEAANAELACRIDTMQTALESLLPVSLKGARERDVDPDQLAKEIRSYSEAQVGRVGVRSPPPRCRLALHVCWLAMARLCRQPECHSCRCCWWRCCRSRPWRLRKPPHNRKQTS